MQLNIINENGTEPSSMEVADAVFNKEYKESLIHQVVTAYLAAARAGTHAAKNRAEVRGGGAKPWRQKGTGRARAGTSSSPIWRGGGMTFAKKPRSYAQKVNRKMYRCAMRSIWSELIRQDRLIVTEAFQLELPKTKQLLTRLRQLAVHKCLLVTESEDTKLALAARNLPYVDVCSVDKVNPYGLVAVDKVIIFNKALKKIEEHLQ